MCVFVKVTSIRVYVEDGDVDLMILYLVLSSSSRDECLIFEGLLGLSDHCP